ncbi:MAG: PilZ domain-containing protein [Candidatus Omnitrophota bacterium]
MQERRKFLRLKENDKICFSEIPYSKSERILSLDVSIGGVRFLSNHFIKPQSTLKIEMAFERAKKAINVLAVVKWIKSVYEDERYEVGAEFVDIDKEDARFLNDYVRSKD